MRKFREMIFSGGNKGFTLIELLVVIAVLGILAGIAIPRISGVTDEAEKAEVRATGSSIRSAVELYIASQNEFPGDTNGLDFSSSQYNIGVNLNDYGINVTDASTTGYSITVTAKNSDGTTTGAYSVTVSPTGITEPTN